MFCILDKILRQVYYCINTVVQLKGVKSVKSKLDKKKPLCPQLCEQICINIANGIYKDGGRLPSVRELAVTAGVNPNTAQRAYETLETQGVIYSVRGSGWYVVEDEAQSEKVMSNLLKEKTEEYFEAMLSFGLSKEQIKEYVKEW